MTSRGRGPIDDELARFVRGPVSALLGTADDTAFPDATRISGVSALDDRRLRVLISADAATARANAVPGARAAVLVTNVLSYRSTLFKGAVTIASPVRSAGDLALVDRHVQSFVDSADVLGIDPARADRVFAVEVVPVVVEVDTVFDQTPGAGAGRRIEATR